MFSKTTIPKFVTYKTMQAFIEMKTLNKKKPKKKMINKKKTKNKTKLYPPPQETGNKKEFTKKTL